MSPCYLDWIKLYIICWTSSSLWCSTLGCLFTISLHLILCLPTFPRLSIECLHATLTGSSSTLCAGHPLHLGLVSSCFFPQYLSISFSVSTFPRPSVRCLHATLTTALAESTLCHSGRLNTLLSLHKVELTFFIF